MGLVPLILVRLDGPAFGVPFVGNEGYDPGEPGLPNQDLPINWREDEVAGADTYPINPIPSSEPGGGTYFGVEYGTATTAPFLDPNDNFFSDYFWRGFGASRGELARGLSRTNTYDKRFCDGFISIYSCNVG